MNVKESGRNLKIYLRIKRHIRIRVKWEFYIFNQLNFKNNENEIIREHDVRIIP